MNHYIIIALKSIAVYLFIVLAIRIFGKKELAQLTVIDLVFILLISNSVQNAMVGNDNSLLGGLVAALGLFICNFLFKLVLHKSKKIDRLIQGEPILLIHSGKIIDSGLTKALMSKEELERAIREHGVNSVEDVDLAVLEVDGNISILSSDYKTKTVRKRRKPQISHNP